MTSTLTSRSKPIRIPLEDLQDEAENAVRFAIRKAWCASINGSDYEMLDYLDEMDFAVEQVMDQLDIRVRASQPVPFTFEDYDKESFNER